MDFFSDEQQAMIALGVTLIVADVMFDEEVKAARKREILEAAVEIMNDYGGGEAEVDPALVEAARAKLKEMDEAERAQQ